MTTKDAWLLPEGVDEWLPPQARQLEALRRRTLDRMGTWGYEMVMPPLLEYLDSLVTGMGTDLERQTFKLTDQISGALMGLRADITPQVARIDAHRLQREAATRLCYIGSVLHTLPQRFLGSRNPLQLGAELYGHAGIEADVEVLELMLDILQVAGMEQVHVNLGHIGIFRALVQGAGLDVRDQARVFEVLQRKAGDELDALLESLAPDREFADSLRVMLELNGGPQVLSQARTALRAVPQHVSRALDELEQMLSQLANSLSEDAVHIDLAEMRGYDYHSGVMFEAFVPGLGQSVGWGGRYDNIGERFGRARPATGFSTNLKLLSAFAENPDTASSDAQAILAPAQRDRELDALIKSLRGDGEVVVRALGDDDPVVTQATGTRTIAYENGRWTVKNLKT